jgi:hypothetical protein
VGKSTIGFRYYMKCLSAGLTVGYVDLNQIGFLQPPPPAGPGSQRLRARNLAAIWRNYRAEGATHLVATGMIASQADLRVYAGELPGTHIALIRLRAGSGELRRRIMSRSAGGSWPEPGDRFRGQSTEFLMSAADQAAQAAEALDRSDVGGLAVDTTSFLPDESGRPGPFGIWAFDCPNGSWVLACGRLRSYPPPDTASTGILEDLCPYARSWPGPDASFLSTVRGSADAR